MEWAGHVARMMGKEKCVGALVGKPENERTLGRSKIRWKDNIKMYFQETLSEGVK